MDQFVYVIYDQLYKTVVCVHDEEDMDCEMCIKIRESRALNPKAYAYSLEQSTQLVRKSLDKIRDEKIEIINGTK
jgi:hypothetical protein